MSESREIQVGDEVELIEYCGMNLTTGTTGIIVDLLKTIATVKFQGRTGLHTGRFNYPHPEAELNDKWNIEKNSLKLIHKSKTEQMSNQSLQPEVALNSETIRLLKGLGINLPASVKEITTPVEESSETRKIILPTGMDKLTASKELENQWKNEETKMDFDTNFEGWNWKDALIAIKRVTEREFGWMNAKGSFMGNPTEIDIITDIVDGKTKTEKAFYGKFEITGWEKASCNIYVQKGQVTLSLTAKKKFEKPITAYFALIREQLEKESIYRGKNLVVTKDGNGNLDFEIIENKVSDKIVLNEKTESVVQTFILDTLGEKGKRSYLFTGTYGNAKTETAMRVGHEAVKRHGQSFFYAKDASIFDELLNLCKRYQPCLIFLEDVDEIASGEERDAKMNKILNTLDGVQTKGNNLKVIFTTNHPEKINKALRRPGRIDLMLLFDNPDERSREKILHLYLDKFKGSDTLDYTGLAKEINNVSGAVVAEVAKRAEKLAKNKGEVIYHDVLACIASMEYQNKLMNDEIDAPNKYETFVKLQAELLGREMFATGDPEQVKLQVAEIWDRV